MKVTLAKREAEKHLLQQKIDKIEKEIGRCEEMITKGMLMKDEMAVLQVLFLTSHCSGITLYNYYEKQEEMNNVQMRLSEEEIEEQESLQLTADDGEYLCLLHVLLTI